MMPWSKEPVTRLFTVADRCRNTSRRPGFTETEHCCRPLSREHCCRPVSSEDQLGHQLAPLKWAPFCACQAEQQRSRTQSCTGALSLARQSSNAASSNAPTQPCTLGICQNQRRRPCLVIVATRAFAWRDAFLHTLPWRADDVARQELMARVLMRRVGSGGPCTHSLVGLVPNCAKGKKKAHIHPHIHLKRIPKLKSCQMGRWDMKRL